MDDESFQNKDLNWKIKILINVAEGLKLLHKKGIIHADIKPSNIII